MYNPFMEDIFYKLLLLRTRGIGPAKYADLINQFESPELAAKSLMMDSELIDAVRFEMDKAASLGVVYIADDDIRYPDELKQVKNHPPIITVRGNLDVLSKPKISIVGTRHASAAGISFVRNLATEFVERGTVVVSGLAIGTDTAAHMGALAADGNTTTIAVVAGGADYIWPLENERLYYEIMQRGAIISDMPVGFTPVAKNFVARNRLVAGISDTLILGEADSKSGSMTTAGFAMDMGKKLYAIPSHPMDPRSAGPNQLIRENRAKLCIGIEDFYEINQKDVQKNKPNQETTNENDLLSKIGIIPVSESVLSELVKKSVSEIKAELTVLELQGKIAKVNGGYILL